MNNIKQEECPLDIRFTGNEKWASFNYFDSNLYPSIAKSEADSCGDRYSLLLYYQLILNPQLEIDSTHFLENLNKNAVNLKYKHKWTKCEASYHSIVHLATLHGVLFNLKSFLDCLTRLWGKTLDSECKVKLFSTKNIEGKELSGGKFINWLKNGQPKESSRTKLANLVFDNSDDWITQAVKYRNDLIHYGGIKGIKGLTSTVEELTKDFRKEDIIYPKMPDGTYVSDYCDDLLKKLEKLIVDGSTVIGVTKA